MEEGGQGGWGAGAPHILTVSPEKPFPIKIVLFFFALLHIFGRSAGIQTSQGLGFDGIVLLRHCIVVCISLTQLMIDHLIPI